MNINETIGENKNFFCRDSYWQLMNDAHHRIVFKSVKGGNLRKCTYSDCRGAHTESEIQILPSIYNFNTCDKSKINLSVMYYNIIKQFDKDKPKIKHIEYINKLTDYKTLNFVQLLNLWYDVTCFHRKLKKDISKSITICDLYSSINDIPDFFIENENDAWNLERVTKLCPDNYNLNKKIVKDKAIIWDICIGSINCKKGCHNVAYMVCNDNLISGKCDCISLESFNSKKQILETNKSRLINILNSPNNEKIKSKLKNIENELSQMVRKIHLTEQGLIPFDEQNKLYIEKLKKVETDNIQTIQNIADEKEERMFQLKNSKVKKIIKKPLF